MWTKRQVNESLLSFFSSFIGSFFLSITLWFSSSMFLAFFSYLLIHAISSRLNSDEISSPVWLASLLTSFSCKQTSSHPLERQGERLKVQSIMRLNKRFAHTYIRTHQVGKHSDDASVSNVWCHVWILDSGPKDLTFKFQMAANDQLLCVLHFSKSVSQSFIHSFWIGTVHQSINTTRMWIDSD